MRIGPLVIASAVLFALAGCVQSGSGSGSPTAAPSPSATPVFASDAEALAAAETAYAAYLKVSDEIAHDGGKDPARIAEYVSTSRLQAEIRDSGLFESRKIRTTGSTAFRNSALQQIESVGKETEVVLYACWDATAVRLVDVDGRDVTPADRPDQQTLQLVFTTTNNTLPLRLKTDDLWSGHSYC